MFIGHYGVALAAKGIQPRLSLGILFLAVQFLDVLFAIFVLAGVEKMRIVTGFTAYNPYDLYFMPFTHSLLGAAIWSIVLAFGLCLFSVSKNPTRRIFSLFVALAVFSHFLFDLPMHTADLTLGFSGQDIKFGFGLWNYMWLSLLAELVVFGFGIVLYWNSNKHRFNSRSYWTLGFFLLMTLLLLATPFLPPPGSPEIFAIQALVAFFGLAVTAELVSRQHDAVP